MKAAWNIVKGTINGFMEDRALRLSAALAYYAMFSIGPLLVITVGIAGLVFGEESVRHELQRQLASYIGDRSARIVQSMMAFRDHHSSRIATTLGIIALLFGATGVFGQLQDALNTIWKVKERPGLSIWLYIRDRFLSFAMVLGVGFLLLVSMVLSTFISAFTGFVSEGVSMPGWVAQLFNELVSMVVTTLLFAMVFKVLPDVKLKWRPVWIGAFGTSLLFTVGKYLLALYLGRESTASAYGAAGSVVVVLMWVYYASVILFLGAEFTRVYTQNTGSKVIPSEYAVRDPEAK